MSARNELDATDARLLLALNEEPRATVLWLAQKLGISRNTVQARLTAIESRAALFPFERRVDPAALGYPLTAFIMVTVDQKHLDDFAAQLSSIPGVVEAVGLSGDIDMFVRVAGQDIDDLYAVAGRILATPGVERTSTCLAMRRMVDYRTEPLLRAVANKKRAKSDRGIKPVDEFL